MLREDMLEAVKSGRFQYLADRARRREMELLTGTRADNAIGMADFKGTVLRRSMNTCARWPTR